MRTLLRVAAATRMVPEIRLRPKRPGERAAA
jgi:hypothetical protein